MQAKFTTTERCNERNRFVTRVDVDLFHFDFNAGAGEPFKARYPYFNKFAKATLDTRIIAEVRNGTAAKGNKGFVSSPSVAGGWPSLKSGIAPVDTDHDGMPDEWETKQGLNPNAAADRNKVSADGYTMLEKYLNSIE